LNQIVDAIQIAIESNRDLILPVSGIFTIAPNCVQCSDIFVVKLLLWF